VIVLFTGSRDWKDRDSVRRVLESLREEHGLNLTVVEGGADGLDTIARELCHELGVDVITYWANWKGRSTPREDGGVSYWAGPWRNQRMLDHARPNRAYAFHPFIDRSKGTKDMVGKLREAGVPTVVCTPTRKGELVQ